MGAVHSPAWPIRLGLCAALLWPGVPVSPRSRRLCGNDGAVLSPLSPQVREGLPPQLALHRQLPHPLPPAARQSALLLPAAGQGRAAPHACPRAACGRGHGLTPGPPQCHPPPHPTYIMGLQTMQRRLASESRDEDVHSLRCPLWPRGPRDRPGLLARVHACRGEPPAPTHMVPHITLLESW